MCDLNDPFVLIKTPSGNTRHEKQKVLNKKMID